MLILTYFIVAIIILYTEAIDTYRCKAKFELSKELIFSFAWPVSLPYSVYSIWKELK